MEGTLAGYLVCALLAAACGYLLGSLNGGIVAVRLMKHEDVRNFGSGNAGLTNVLRCFGKGCGILTAVIDLGKGAAAIALTGLLCRLISPAALLESHLSAAQPWRELCYLAAVFAVLGHVFPIWHGFHGGKGVLVGVSVFLVLNPLVFCILMAIFGLVLWRSKYVSLASIVATLCVIPVTPLMEHFQRGEGAFYTVLYTLLIFVAAFLIVWSHRENIKRLREGTERRIGEKKNSADTQK